MTQKKKVIHSKTEYIKQTKCIPKSNTLTKGKCIPKSNTLTPPKSIPKLNTLKQSNVFKQPKKQQKKGKNNPHSPSLPMDGNNNKKGIKDNIYNNNVFKNYYYYISLALHTQFEQLPQEPSEGVRFLLEKTKQICKILLDDRTRSILLLLYMFDYNYRNNIDRLTNCSDTSGRRLALLQEFKLIQRVPFDLNNPKIQAMINNLKEYKFLSFTGRMQLFELTPQARKFISKSPKFFAKGYQDATIIPKILEETKILNAELQKIIQTKKQEEKMTQDSLIKPLTHHQIEFFTRRKLAFDGDRVHYDALRKAYFDELGVKLTEDEIRKLAQRIKEEVWNKKP